MAGFERAAYQINGGPCSGENLICIFYIETQRFPLILFWSIWFEIYYPKSICQEETPLLEGVMVKDHHLPR